jgi:flagellar hook-length control protein FliK
VEAAGGAVPGKSVELGSAAHAGARPREAGAEADQSGAARAAAETAHGAAPGAGASDVNAPTKPPGATDQSPAASEPRSLPSQLAAPGQVAGHTSAASSPLPHAPIRVVADVPLHAVPIEIGLKSLAGVNHFEIRLDPAELGRIEVRLEIDKDGEVKAHLSVDRVETLALLQRDAKNLERAFEQAGLKPSDGGVNLALRDQQSQGQGRHENAGQHERGEGGPRTQTALAAEEQAGAHPVTRRLSWGVTGIDVRV